MSEINTYLPYLFNGFVGIGLAASTGFRVFLPVFLLSLASYLGFIPINEEWQWMSGLPTLITTGIATVLEIFAYYIPWVDNFVDVLAVPFAGIAGTLLFASQFTEIDGFAQWSLALIAGGGTAAAIGSGMSVLRAASTATTGGITNSVVSTSENLGAFALPVISLVLPVLALIIVIVLLILIYSFGKKLFLGKKLKR